MVGPSRRNTALWVAAATGVTALAVVQVEGEQSHPPRRDAVRGEAAPRPRDRRDVRDGRLGSNATGANHAPSLEGDSRPPPRADLAARRPPAEGHRPGGQGASGRRDGPRLDFAEPGAPVRTEIDPPRLLESPRGVAVAPVALQYALAALDGGRPLDAGSGRGLVMYATDWCPVCTRARRWMSSNGIEFEERDVEEDRSAARRHAELNPRRSVPTFERDGRTLIGFSPGALRGLLEEPR